MSLQDIIVGTIRAHGPLHFSEFMNRALYDPTYGFYTQHAIINDTRSHFHTIAAEIAFSHSIVGLYIQFAAELPLEILRIVVMGDGNGELSDHILGDLRTHQPRLYERTQLVHIDKAQNMLDSQVVRLQTHPRVTHVHASAVDYKYPLTIGMFVSNELPDAFPVDVVFLGSDDQLYEVFVDIEDNRLTLRHHSTSREDVASYLARYEYTQHLRPVSMCGKPSVRAQHIPHEAVAINFDLVNWYERVSMALQKGIIITADYGPKNPGDLLQHLAVRGHAHYHSLTGQSHVLSNPGQIDLTSDVNFGIPIQIGQKNALQQLTFCDARTFMYRFTGIDHKYAAGYHVLVHGRDAPPIRWNVHAPNPLTTEEQMSIYF